MLLGWFVKRLGGMAVTV